MHGNLCITGGEHGASTLEVLTTHAVTTCCLVPTLIGRLVAELRSTGATIQLSDDDKDNDSLTLSLTIALSNDLDMDSTA